MKLLRNKKGQALEGATLGIAIFIVVITTMGLTKTAEDGTLKKNGKKIWCKMQNKGNDYCDQLYQ